jgi:hypothetical protein
MDQYQPRLYVYFKIQSYDQTREWHLAVPAHKVANVLNEALTVMRASRDPHATLRLTSLEEAPPRELYIRTWNGPSQTGDGQFFPVCPNVQRL